MPNPTPGQHDADTQGALVFYTPKAGAILAALERATEVVRDRIATEGLTADLSDLFDSDLVVGCRDDEADRYALTGSADTGEFIRVPPVG